MPGTSYVDTLISWHTIIVIVFTLTSTVIGTLLFYIRKINRYITGVATMLELIPTIDNAKRDHAKLSDMCDSVKIIASDVDEIKKTVHKELNFNGGGSIKDAINDIRIMTSLIDGKFRCLVSWSNLIGWESDIKGECVWVSYSLAKLADRSEEFFLGEGWKSIIAPEDRGMVTKEWASAIEQRRAFFLEYNLVRSDNLRIPVVAESFCLRDPKSDRVIGFVGIIKIRCGNNREFSDFNDYLKNCN